MASEIGRQDQPLGTGRDLRARLLRHHVPLGLACVAVLTVFTALPVFDAAAHPHADVFSGVLPQARTDGHGGFMDHGGGSGRVDHGPGRGGGMDHAAGAAIVTDHRAGGGAIARGSGSGSGVDHGPARGAPRDHGGASPSPSAPEASGNPVRGRGTMRQLTFATGYVALGLLALTLLIGPANLLLNRRNPVSSYLRRDAGMWTAVASGAHVVFGLQVHGGGRISGVLQYFVAPDGRPWLNSFGLANWTGLAATVIALGLLVTSSDAALRRLKAGPWKQLQRLNYALFALVVLHAFFYGALLRTTSPYTLVLGLGVVAVFIGQAVGVWLWRRRYGRSAHA